MIFSKFTIFFSLAVITFLLLVAPVVVFAQDGGLLAGTCVITGQACQLLDLLILGSNISRFILRYVGVVVLIFLIIGGIVWITASGNPERIKKGKGIIVGSLIGMFIVFFAWQIVDLTICAIVQGGGTRCRLFGSEWYKFPETPVTTPELTPESGKKCWELGGHECISGDLCKENTTKDESCAIAGALMLPGIVCCQREKDCKQYGNNYDCLVSDKCKEGTVKAVCLWKPKPVWGVEIKACCEPKEQ